MNGGTSGMSTGLSNILTDNKPALKSAAVLLGNYTLSVKHTNENIHLISHTRTRISQIK